MKSIAFEEFKSQFIRSMQESGISESELNEYRKILDSPTGELIIRAALFAAKQK